MATQESSGTATIITIGTEQVLASLLTAKPFTVYVDITNLQAGEYLQVKVKRSVLAGGTAGTIKTEVYSWLDALVTPVITLPTILSTQLMELVINQLTGSTARVFPWAIETP